VTFAGLPAPARPDVMAFPAREAVRALAVHPDRVDGGADPADGGPRGMRVTGGQDARITGALENVRL
jgi:hypothetical protein